MSLRGETIGTAFVRILADGRDLPDSIKDEFDRATPVVEAAGQKHGKAYDEARAAELKKAGPGKLDKALTESLGRSDAIEDYFTGPRWQKIVRRLDKQFSEDGHGLGLTIAANIEQGVRESGDLGVLSSRLGNITKEIILANRQIIAAMKEEQTAFERSKQSGIDTEVHMRKLVEDFRKMEEVAHKARLAEEGLADSVEDAAVSTERLLSRSGRLAERIKNDSVVLGKTFGKGSRNDALNFFGSAVGGMVSLTSKAVGFAGKIGGSIGKIKDFAKEFGVARDAGEGLFEAFQSAGKEGSTLFEGIAKSGPAAAVAIAVIVAALGPVAAILSGLAAAVTAVAASITFGLIGALAPLVGLIPILAIAVGTLALGIGSVTAEASKNNKALDKAKASVKTYTDQVKAATPGTQAHENAVKKLNIALKEQREAQDKVNHSVAGSFAALKPTLDALKSTASDNLFAGLPDQLKRLKGPLSSLQPLVAGTSLALNNVFRGFIDGLNSPGFKRFIDTMTSIVPDAVETIGHIIKTTFGGSGGLFQVLAPFALDLLHAIDKITTKFSAFTNSDSGQKKLKDFFKKAAKSAGELVDLLGAIGGLIKTVFSGGKDTGDDIIESITSNVRDFTQYLKDNPHALSDWFANGKDVIQDVGDLAVGIGRILDELDSPEAREQAQLFFSIFKGALKLLQVQLSFIEGPIEAVVVAIKGMVDAVKYVASQWGTVLLSIQLKFAIWAAGILHLADKALGWTGLPFTKKLHKAAQDMDEFVRKTKADIAGIPKGFTITGHLKIAVDAINGAKLSNQARAKLLDLAFDKFAAGGRVAGGVPIWVGEKGKELFVPDGPGKIVPNNDPAVQAMSRTNSAPTSITNSRSRTVDASGWTIVTPTEDPRAVASEIVNKLVGAAL